MEKRILGRTGLEVTPLGFGALELKHLDEKQAAHLMNEVLDNGINYIDTSPDYKLSEELIGKSIAHRRHEYILATKCGDNIQGHEPQRIWTRENLMENLEHSLKTLKTDYIDAWQMHGAMPHYFTEESKQEVIQTMLDVKKSGKVRSIGTTFRNGSKKDELYPAGYGMVAIRELIKWEELETMQIVYGGLTRKNELAISKASEKGIGMIARGVIKNYFDDYDMLYSKAKIAELHEPGETKTEFLIRYALSHPGLSTMIVGTKDVGHMKANIKAADKGRLSEDIYAEAKRRFDSVGVTAEEM